ncbi:MAG: vitamin B12 dependent-methionine synthase activation domain-containing protein, partial [Sulfuricaulis sp.]
TDLKKDFVAKVKSEYDEVRARHKGKKTGARLLTLADARANKTKIDWQGFVPPAPSKPGITVFENYPLEELTRYIDWTPFFITWEMKGRYPDILRDEKTGVEATKLFNDARTLLQRIIQEKLFTAKGVIGLFPANSVNDDDIEVYADDSRKKLTMVLHNLRQQDEKPPGRPNRTLADFVAPKDSGLKDHIGGFAVGIHGADELAKIFEKQHDDYNAIMAKALADRLAEAFAERLHERVRREYWGYAGEETLDNEALVREEYQGIRPAPGYPACPDHTEKELLFKLIDATKHTGVKLTESFAMWPAAAVSGFYFSHSESRYFAVGNMGKDQIEDYARRKEEKLKVLERWLSPNLAYEPQE